MLNVVCSRPSELGQPRQDVLFTIPAAPPSWLRATEGVRPVIPTDIMDAAGSGPTRKKLLLEGGIVMVVRNVSQMLNLLISLTQ